MSSIYHFENYIQIHKLNLVLKIRFNHDKLASPPLRAKWIKTFYTIETELGIKIYCQARIFTVFTHRERKGINV